MRPAHSKSILPLLTTLFSLFPLALRPATAQDSAASKPFAIEVLDEQTLRGVPLVELTTVSGVAYVTDSAGLAAVGDPALLGQRVFFHVQSHGYDFRKDGFGFRGQALDTLPGGSATIKLRRTNIAERLYRLTGEGLYRDSLLLGRAAPIRQPLLNAKVTGSDSVVNALYQGKLYWFWGDTNRPAYPLGNYHVPGAVSSLPAQGGLPPGQGVNLDYFVNGDGFARPTAKMPGDGPTWIDGLVVLPDQNGREQMLCAYAKIKPPLEAYRRGVAQWDDEAKEFRHLADIPAAAPLYPRGHPLLPQAAQQAGHLYFAAPFPLIRTRATAEAYADAATYEAYTCLREGTSLSEGQVERDDEGRPRYAWKRNTPPLSPAEEARLVREGKLAAGAAVSLVKDAAGKQILLHAGSVAWNDFRRRYVLIAVEQYGSSFLGEVWYAEAENLTGPWSTAVKIVSHDKYSFYNPKQHPYFAEDGGRVIYFEGTYTHTFSGNPRRTPRYDYNQIMYRLNLTDPRLTP